MWDKTDTDYPSRATATVDTSESWQQTTTSCANSVKLIGFACASSVPQWQRHRTTIKPCRQGLPHLVGGVAGLRLDLSQPKITPIRQPAPEAKHHFQTLTLGNAIANTCQSMTCRFTQNALHQVALN
jgi:hypothetical protein